MNSLRNDVLSEQKILYLLPPHAQTKLPIPHYLVEKIDSKFHVHRQLNFLESTYYESKRLMYYERELYLKNLYVANNMFEATAYVDRLWRLNEPFEIKLQRN